MRKNLLKIGGGLILISLLTILVLRVTAPSSTASTSGTCATKVTYLAYNPSTKLNNFGPAVKPTTLQGVLNTLHARRCIDPALVTAHAVYYHLSGFKPPASQAAWRKMVANVAGNHSLWLKTIERLEGIEARAQLSLGTNTKPYNSAWFGIHGLKVGQIPYLFKGPIGSRYSRLLIIRLPNGVVFMLRLECGYQPFGPKVKTPPKPPTTPKVTCPNGKPIPPNGLCPKDPALDPQSKGNVPKQATKNHPSVDNKTEVHGKPVKPVESGDGLGGGKPRKSPPPAPTTPPSGGGGPTLPPATEAPSPAPSPTSTITGTPSSF